MGASYYPEPGPDVPKLCSNAIGNNNFAPDLLGLIFPVEAKGVAAMGQ